MSGDNYHDVMQQMSQFGIELRKNETSLRLDTTRRVTCGKGGKFWYRLSTFRPDAGGVYIVGRFGSYKSGDSEKVVVDWQPLSEAEKARRRAEHEAKRAKDAADRERENALAAMSAAQLWREASPTGSSPYLVRKQVTPECCRFLPDQSIVIPLLRYDWPRELALVGTQRIYPAPRKHWRTGEDLPQKTFTKGFAKSGAALRFGQVLDVECDDLILVAEGFSTALSIRMATDRALPVFMALDAYNLQLVCELIRRVHPAHRLLICADDDWRTRDHDGDLWNAGRVKAKQAAKAIDRCDVVYPSFAGLARGDKDTDFNDLHVLGGLDRVHAQMTAVLDAIRRHRAPAGD